VRYPVAFTGDVRRVEITGEAYFEVAHSNKPFFVSVRGMEVQVLGTVFNINAYVDEEVIKTTLAEGKVKVKTDQAIMVLKPGQQAQATRAGLKLKENADVEQALAWKNGFFQFDNDNLKTVMRQLGRWYDVTVIYEGAVPDISFSGKLRMQSKLSEVLTLLEKWEVRFRAEGNRVIVLPESN
jgi:transmembrane sensor